MTGQKGRQASERNRSARGPLPIPLLAALLGALPALALYLFPAAARWAEYDRGRLAAGQLWRGIASHWAHWDGEHFVLDTLVFCALAAACARRAPGRLAAALALAAAAIPVTLWFALPEMTYYRGLSGPRRLCSRCRRARGPRAGRAGVALPRPRPVRQDPEHQGQGEAPRQPHVRAHRA